MTFNPKKQVISLRLGQNLIDMYLLEMYRRETEEGIRCTMTDLMTQVLAEYVGVKHYKVYKRLKDSKRLEKLKKFLHPEVDSCEEK